MKIRYMTLAALLSTAIACGDDPIEPDTNPVGRPDLVVASISEPVVACPGGPGTCTTMVEVLIENVGDGASSAYNFRVTLDPVQSILISVAVPGGLPPSLAQRFELTTPEGGNCYDPDCTVTVLVDDLNQVVESDETNNTASATAGG